MSEYDSGHSFEALLEYLKIHRGFDLTGYKRNSLRRRTRRRMQVVGIDSFDEYRDYLEVHPEEFSFLFNTILINVTSFFRDEAAWRYLASELMPSMIGSRPPGEPIRAWSAGCASGEEAYSLAILLCEALSSFHPGDDVGGLVKVYATDVDEEALAEARQASYRPEAMTAVPSRLREEHFELAAGRYTVRPDLRRRVIFGRHDLAQDAPISNLDLLVCRNTLIYFNAETQRRILARFHFALREEGILFLGQAEMLLSHAHLFAPVEIKHRIFSKLPQPSRQEWVNVLVEASNGEGAAQGERSVRLREAVLDAVPSAQLVVDPERRIVSINRLARLGFHLDERDVGRALQDLEISYRPVELRSLIDQAESEGREMLVSNVERVLPGGGVQYLDVRVMPLCDQSGQLLGLSVTFEDVSRRRELEAEAAEAQEELETAYEELQSTNEELETTNEELQSAVEELQTTNEELQSTNEEMETMNEELHSSNEELRDMNLELRQRTEEGQRANAFLHSILSSVDLGVVVVDPDLRVLLWNHRAEDLWGLRAEEVRGQSLMALDIGLPVKELEEPLRTYVSEDPGDGQIRVEARNRRGQKIVCHLQATQQLGADGEMVGVVLVMEEERV